MRTHSTLKTKCRMHSYLIKVMGACMNLSIGILVILKEKYIEKFIIVQAVLVQFYHLKYPMSIVSKLKNIVVVCTEHVDGGQRETKYLGELRANVKWKVS